MGGKPFTAYHQSLIEQAENQELNPETWFMPQLFCQLSPLPAANIKEGDLILSLNGINLNSAQDLVRRLNQEFELGEKVILGVYDGQVVTEVPIRLWDPGRRISQFSLWPLFNYSAFLNPASNRLTILDFWLVSLYSCQRLEGERSHSIFGLFNFSTDYGELTEESN